LREARRPPAVLDGLTGGPYGPPVLYMNALQRRQTKVRLVIMNAILEEAAFL